MRAGRIWRNRRGATATEYALIAALIAISAVPAIIAVGATNDQIFWQAAFALGIAARD